MSSFTRKPRIAGRGDAKSQLCEPGEPERAPQPRRARRRTGSRVNVRRIFSRSQRRTSAAESGTASSSCAGKLSLRRKRELLEHVLEMPSRVVLPCTEVIPARIQCGGLRVSPWARSLLRGAWVLLFVEGVLGRLLLAMINVGIGLARQVIDTLRKKYHWNNRLVC